MGELRVRSVLVTGANRGIGLGFVQHLLALPNPPEWVFAGCRDPKGQRAQVRLGWDAAEVGDSRAAAGVGMCEGLHHGAAAPAPGTREAECDGHGMSCAWAARGSWRRAGSCYNCLAPCAPGLEAKGWRWLGRSECDTRLTAAVFYCRSCRNWPPSTPTWSLSRSVGDTAAPLGCLPGLPALLAPRPPTSLVQGSVPALCCWQTPRAAGTHLPPSPLQKSPIPPASRRPQPASGSASRARG